MYLSHLTADENTHGEKKLFSFTKIVEKGRNDPPHLLALRRTGCRPCIVPAIYPGGEVWEMEGSGGWREQNSGTHCPTQAPATLSL